MKRLIRASWRARWRAGWCAAVITSLALGSGFLSQTTTVHAQEKTGIADQIAGDLVGAGVSIGAALSGSVPLAFAAGYISKYLVTYGIGGIKSAIDYVKGYGPRDLSEINLLYVYLLHVKQNLYGTLIEIRKSVAADNRLSYLSGQLEKVERGLNEECAASGGCSETAVDHRYVNLHFLNLILDAKETLQISKYLGEQEVRHTYHYLMLLYLDVVILEQRLIEAQADVLADRTTETLKVLQDNPYLSNEEKEYQAQLLMNLSLRWIRLADSRKRIVARAIEAPLEKLNAENGDLQKDIDDYKRKHGFLAFASFRGGDRDDGRRYEEYLGRLEREARADRMFVDPFSQNPFQTGTTLQAYYLQNTTLIQAQQAYFQMKSNRLQTTEEVGDYAHRLRVLKDMAGNIMAQLTEAIEWRNKEGFSRVEEPKSRVEFEKLVEDCNKDADCVASRLKQPETTVKNLLIDNFRLAARVFQHVPHMHVLEANAVYQLVQLMQLEILYSQNRLQRVEFEVFQTKQERLSEVLKKNTALTGPERDYHLALIRNTVNTWKKRILERRYDHRAEYQEQAQKLQTENHGLLLELVQSRKDSPHLFGNRGLTQPPKDGCFFLAPRQDRRECQSQRELSRRLRLVEQRKFEFLGSKESKLPESFWRNL